MTNNGTGDDANSNSGTIEVNDVSAVVNATNSGTIILNKQIVTGSAISDSNGTIALANGVTMPAGVGGTNVVSAESVGDSFGMSQDLESDYTVKTSAFLANDLTIPEGVTLTIDGALSLNGKKLFVEGTLAVGKKGAITNINFENDGAIVLSKTGTIVNEGIIGKDSTVKVADKNATPKTVSMKNVIGLSFGLTKEIVDGVPTYTLTVSGEAAKKGDAPTLTIDGAYISDLVVKDLESEVTITGNVLKDGSLNIGSKATVAPSNVTLQNGATLMIDGKITNGTITMWNGSSATINGDASGITFTAETGEYPTYNGSQKNDLDKDETLIVDSSSIKTYLKGITIDITSKVYSKKNSGVTTSYTMQMMEVYGTPSFKDKDTDNGEIDIDGEVYIPAGQELVLVVGMELDTEADVGTGDETEGTVITEGTLKISES
ncbi:MAG: hypothetical protein IJV90_05390 [Candidatus Methanomethylophilaceae archaeon]|nr:hypothetical protein [Candidatus Methanomethylophilaceae archaeon]